MSKSSIMDNNELTLWNLNFTFGCASEAIKAFKNLSGILLVALIAHSFI